MHPLVSPLVPHTPPQDGRHFLCWCTWAQTWCQGVYSAPVDMYLRLDKPSALFLPTRWVRRG